MMELAQQQRVMTILTANALPNTATPADIADITVNNAGVGAQVMNEVFGSVL